MLKIVCSRFTFVVGFEEGELRFYVFMINCMVLRKIDYEMCLPFII